MKRDSKLNGYETPSVELINLCLEGNVLFSTSTEGPGTSEGTGEEEL